MDSPRRPRLPWEVIERVIDHSRGRAKTLKNLALTCRQLLPRTRLMMFAYIRFNSRDDVFAFVDLLKTNPHLLPVVCSIKVWPPDLAPFPLLHMLPSLLEIEFAPMTWSRSGIFPELGLHQSSLACFQRFGTNIRTLRLSRLPFKGIIPFARVLLAFKNATHLVCDNVEIGETDQSSEEPPSLPETIRRWPSQRARVKSLTVDSQSLVTDKRITSLGQLLLDPSSSAPSMIESLSLRRILNVSSTAVLFKSRPNWDSLRSLALQATGGAEVALKLLKTFPKGLLLTDLTLELHINDLRALRHDMSCSGVGAARHGTYKQLELALLAKSSQPKINYVLDHRNPLSVNNRSFWLAELRNHFPVLSERGAITLQFSSEDGEFVVPDGHDEAILALAVSPDGKWVASGSDDSTTIFWETDGGTIAQQWVAHSYMQVYTLAFSPDGQYLVSGGDDSEAAIWALSPSQEARRVTTLEGHTGAVLTCAWSPDGSTIATGSSDRTTRLWHARTFRQRALHDKFIGAVDHLTFSPDGRWLACTTKSRECIVLDVALGMLYMSFGSHPCSNRPGDESRHAPRLILPSHDVASAAFDPASTRLAIAPFEGSPRINIIDVETGNTLLPWKSEAKPEAVEDISFSPDGKLVLGRFGESCYLWDASTGNELVRLKGHEGNVRTARFSPCGKYMASSSWDQTVRVWKTSDWSCLTTLSGHKHWVGRVEFSADGKTLSSGCRNGTVIVRRMRDIIPPVERQGDRAFITSSSPSIIDPPLPPTAPSSPSVIDQPFPPAAPSSPSVAGPLLLAPSSPSVIDQPLPPTAPSSPSVAGSLLLAPSSPSAADRLLPPTAPFSPVVDPLLPMNQDLEEQENQEKRGPPSLITSPSLHPSKRLRMPRRIVTNVLKATVTNSHRTARQVASHVQKYYGKLKRFGSGKLGASAPAF